MPDWRTPTQNPSQPRNLSIIRIEAALREAQAPVVLQTSCLEKLLDLVVDRTTLGAFILRHTALAGEANMAALQALATDITCAFDRRFLRLDLFQGQFIDIEAFGLHDFQYQY